MSFAPVFFAAVVTSLVPSAATACSYPFAPEPVGHSSAEFFARRMATTAAFVDVALAENDNALENKRELRMAVMRSLVKVKGGGPDRFTLFAQPGKVPSSKIELRHSTLDDGRVYPLSIPWEFDPFAKTMTSCDPGFINPEPGKLYVVYRDANGRLLRTIPYYPDMPGAGFSFVPAVLNDPTGWTYTSMVSPLWPKGEQAPTPTTQSNDHAVISFKSDTPTKEITATLKRLKIKAYAAQISSGHPHVYWLDDVRWPEQMARPDFVENALNIVTNRFSTRDGTPATARALLPLFPAEGNPVRTDALIVRGLIRMADGVERAKGTHLKVEAIEVTGSPASLQRLRSAPYVAEFKPMWLDQQGMLISGIALMSSKRKDVSDDSLALENDRAAIRMLNAMLKHVSELP